MAGVDSHATEVHIQPKKERCVYVRAMPHDIHGNRSQVVKSIPRNSPDFVLLDWLRPAPLSGEPLSCVCEVGDDPWPLILGTLFE